MDLKFFPKIKLKLKRPCYATLGAFTKYPRRSVFSKKSTHIKDKNRFFASQNSFERQ